MSSAIATLDAFVSRLNGFATPFSIELPSGAKRKIGLGEAEFHVGLRNERALRALRTLDEAEIAEAYLHGDIDLDGEAILAGLGAKGIRVRRLNAAPPPM